MRFKEAAKLAERFDKVSGIETCSVTVIEVFQAMHDSDNYTDDDIRKLATNKDHDDKMYMILATWQKGMSSCSDDILMEAIDIAYGR